MWIVGSRGGGGEEVKGSFAEEGDILECFMTGGCGFSLVGGWSVEFGKH